MDSPRSSHSTLARHRPSIFNLDAGTHRTVLRGETAEMLGIVIGRSWDEYDSLKTKCCWTPKGRGEEWMAGWQVERPRAAQQHLPINP